MAALALVDEQPGLAQAEVFHPQRHATPHALGEVSTELEVAGCAPAVARKARAAHEALP